MDAIASSVSRLSNVTRDCVKTVRGREPDNGEARLAKIGTARPLRAQNGPAWAMLTPARSRRRGVRAHPSAAIISGTPTRCSTRLRS